MRGQLKNSFQTATLLVFELKKKRAKNFQEKLQENQICKL